MLERFTSIGGQLRGSSAQEREPFVVWSSSDDLITSSRLDLEPARKTETTTHGSRGRRLPGPWRGSSASNPRTASRARRPTSTRTTASRPPRPAATEATPTSRRSGAAGETGSEETDEYSGVIWRTLKRDSVCQINPAVPAVVCLE